jgi:hypothetical protein
VKIPPVVNQKMSIFFRLCWVSGIDSKSKLGKAIIEAYHELQEKRKTWMNTKYMFSPEKIQQRL